MPAARPPLSLAPYRHVLLDMNGTFVLDFDRFGPGADFAATYTRLGYASLAPAAVQRAVRRAYDYLAARYVDPASSDRFPTVPEALAATRRGAYPAGVGDELAATFAEHELGRVPPAHRAALARLAARRPVSVLSNLWAPPGRWRRAFADWGIAAHFDRLLFTSEIPGAGPAHAPGTLIKPHPALFAEAARRLGLPPERILYVGDNYRRDVLGATAAGFAAAWVHPDAAAAEGPHVAAAADLPSLVAQLGGRGA